MADQAGPSSAAPVPQDPALLAEADAKFEQGVKCIKDGAMERAVQLFSEVLQVRAKHYGELAPECASAYYRYGSALLYQAQDSSDVLGAPLSGAAEGEDDADEKENEERPSSAAAGSGASEGGAGGSSAAADDKGKGKAPAASEEEGGDEEEEEESGGAAESDLQLAWEHLESAKAIWAQQPDKHTLQLADVHLLLGDVGCENEDFEGALADYDHSLTYLQKGTEGSDRRVAEVQYKRCMALQFLDRPEEALGAVQAAIASLDARTAHLKEQLAAEGTEAAEKERAQHELEDIAAVSAELADKVEELKDAMEQHLSTKNVLQSALASLSQLEKPPQQQQQAQQQRSEGAAAAGAPQEQQGFDNPAGGAVAAGAGAGAAASAPVKDLGVVGRGTKRLNLAPVQVNATAGTEAAAPAAKKKRSLEDLMGGDGAEGETTIGFGSAPDTKPAAAAPAAAAAAADTKAAAPALPAFLQPSAIQAVYGGGGSGGEEKQAGGQ